MAPSQMARPTLAPPLELHSPSVLFLEEQPSIFLLEAIHVSPPAPIGHAIIHTCIVATGSTLNAGNAFAIQIDGLITLTPDGSFGGNALVIKNSKDVEVFSSNGLGAINGQGYLTRKNASGQNARLIRFIACDHVSIHDIILVDSPTFHLIFAGVSNLEAYQITIRGPNIGATDGIDLSCIDNCYLHHIEVTNRDECISVKTPSQNVLIEEMYCNHSGGMSIGSLNANSKYCCPL